MVSSDPEIVMLRRTMLALIGFATLAPARAWAGKRGAAKRPSKAEIKVLERRAFRPEFRPKRRLVGTRERLPNAQLSLTRPKGWSSRGAGKDAYVLARGKAGSAGALFVTRLKATRLQGKAPVGIVMESVAKRVLGRFHGYRPGSKKFQWEVLEQPRAFHRAGGRAGYMLGRATDPRGGSVEGFVGIVMNATHIHVVAGFWDVAQSGHYRPAAETLLSSLEPG
jgi:hypothetical protein